jgi:beta-glucosidase/6-phospho-beta-glucosidase/beta-galactosidase
MEHLRDLGIEVIADLCHFGVPTWLGGFQDAAFPVLFADYARTFARRYPWVRYFTPVNEIFICASFSALRGWWNECEASDAAFVRALRNLCMAHELAGRGHSRRAARRDHRAGENRSSTSTLPVDRRRRKRTASTVSSTCRSI